MTRILHVIQGGQPQSGADLVTLVYEELRRMAASIMPPWLC